MRCSSSAAPGERPEVSQKSYPNWNSQPLATAGVTRTSVISGAFSRSQLALAANR